MGEYNQLKGQLTALARKAGGSLAVRDLGGILKSGDMVDTENLTTLFVVVPAHTKGEWLSAYETLSDFVVRPFLSGRTRLCKCMALRQQGCMDAAPVLYTPLLCWSMPTSDNDGVVSGCVEASHVT